MTPHLAPPASAPTDQAPPVGRGIGLTARQLETLRYIDAYQQASGGISPSVVEIRNRLDLNSTSGVVRLIEALEERGHIRRMRHRARAIEIVEPQPVPTPSLNGEPLMFVPISHAAGVAHV